MPPTTAAPPAGPALSTAAIVAIAVGAWVVLLVVVLLVRSLVKLPRSSITCRSILDKLCSFELDCNSAAQCVEGKNRRLTSSCHSFVDDDIARVRTDRMQRAEAMLRGILRDVLPRPLPIMRWDMPGKLHPVS